MRGSTVGAGASIEWQLSPHPALVYTYRPSAARGARSSPSPCRCARACRAAWRSPIGPWCGWCGRGGAAADATSAGDPAISRGARLRHAELRKVDPRVTRRARDAARFAASTSAIHRRVGHLLERPGLRTARERRLEAPRHEGLGDAPVAIDAMRLVDVRELLARRAEVRVERPAVGRKGPLAPRQRPARRGRCSVDGWLSACVASASGSLSAGPHHAAPGLHRASGKAARPRKEVVHLDGRCGRVVSCRRRGLLARKHVLQRGLVPRLGTGGFLLFLFNDTAD